MAKGGGGWGGGLIIGCYGMRVFLARLLNVMTDWPGSSIIGGDLVFGRSHCTT